MTGSRTRPAILIAGLLLGLLAVTLQGVQGEELENIPSEDQCRPYIEKALKDLGTEGSHEHTSAEETETASKEGEEPDEDSAADANEADDKSGSREKRDVSTEDQDGDDHDDDTDDKSGEHESEADQDQVETVEISSVEGEDDDKEQESAQADDSKEDEDKTKEGDAEESQEKQEDGDGDGDSTEGKTEESAVVEDETEEKKDEDADKDDNETNEIDDSHEKDEGATDNVESDEQKTEEEVADDKTQEEEEKSADDEATAADSQEDAEGGESKEQTEEGSEQQAESVEDAGDDEEKGDSKEEEVAEKSEEKTQEEESKEDDKKSVEEEEIIAKEAASVEQEPETTEASEEAKDDDDDGKTEEAKDDDDDGKTEEAKDDDDDGKSEEAKDDDDDGKSEEGVKEGDEESKEGGEESKEDGDGKTEEEDVGEDKSEGDGESKAKDEEEDEGTTEAEGEGEGESEEGDESRPEEEELIMEIEIPEVLRPRDHINQLLKLDEENEEKEKAIEKVSDIVLRDLKRLYDNAIKPLETLYKYRDLSNRHFGDPEIFSKPLVLFMGPWSGGKSSIINYLLDIEYKPNSLRTGAEPSPAYFNILMHGEENEVLDGTQLAADWTFSGLQKFGQGLLDRLKGFKMNNKLLEKVNIVEIPGILEIRKQVQRLFPFNDACQWFIDRADIIFLVYDPSKLDVGPETEAILDQLKGREYQTRIILNKADQVKPEELMRVQGALIWNISPLMSSAEPPIMYSTSLWSIPYEAGAPTRLLYAQERAFLRDLRSAVDKRVEHKIASARRFAVRVRNHAKMVDCYLTTYYNHKSFFAKKKDISDRIIESPQDYHIYEGLSTLTNISRYDLPDPDVYRDFFRLNPLYDFPLLSSTCTYFRGCPINRLDVAIAYDLPELVGKYKKSVEAVLHQEAEAAATSAPNAQPQKEAQKAKSGAARMSMS